MATLVLSTVGTALGGPLGGAIGGLIGQAIDQKLFAPAPRKGPRLGDLTLQTSSYGSPIPRIFGTMRVAGTVVWATDLKEDREKLSGGKGQPAMVNYSYSASFAVALSSRTAVRVKRIWADGKILRGAAGDFKTETDFRFYPGDESQTADPLIASIEGETPAFRGLAVAVFEDLQLADFGNRIPMLTFELEADEAAPTLAKLLADVGGGAIACDSAQTVDGYAAHGADVLGAIEPLVESFGLELFDDGVAIRSVDPAVVTILPEQALGCGADSTRAARIERRHAAAESLPSVLTLNYYDPARDFQAGQMRASAGQAGRRQVQVDFPAVIDGGSAKALAQSALARQWAQRERLTLRLPPEFLDLVPGNVLRLPSGTQDWQVERATIEQMVVVAELKRSSRVAASVPAESGRAIGDYDAIAPATAMALFDLPDLGRTSGGVPTLHLAAASGARRWRPVPIELSINGLTSAGRTAIGETVMGTVIVAPAAGQSALIDQLAILEVELVGDEMWLTSCDDAALGEGANLAAVGDELIQFGRAEPIGPRRFKLSRLLRGRRGSEWATGTHLVGERFAMIEPDTLRAIEAISSGAEVNVQARGLGDGADGAVVGRIVGGESLRPPSPVHLTATRRGDNGLDIGWVRRSRSGWAWLDSVDASIGETAERYLVRLVGSAGAVELESAMPDASLSAAEVAALGDGSASVSVSQIGDFAPSREATMAIVLT